MTDYEVLVVGGGPAGLSAALLLGRSRRSVLLCDGGAARNAASHASHSFLTRDGTPPLALREIAREQLMPYASVSLTTGTVREVDGREGEFTATLDDGRRVTSRLLVLATGVRDELPDVPGMAALWGRSVFSCPYCDGWEVRDQPIAVYANGEAAMHLAPLLRQWSRDLVLLTDGPADLIQEERATLQRLGIPLREEPIARLEGEDGELSRIVFGNGDELPRSALFLRTVIHPRTELAAQLGCELTDEPPLPRLIRVDATAQTTVPGVFAAGDVTTRMQQVAMAVASGAMAGAMANHALVRADLEA